MLIILVTPRFGHAHNILCAHEIFVFAYKNLQLGMFNWHVFQKKILSFNWVAVACVSLSCAYIFIISFSKFKHLITEK